MSFIRAGHDLKYFEGTSKSYVFLASNSADDDGWVEDYDDDYEDNATFADLLIRFIDRALYYEDKDYIFKIAGILENKLGVKRKPREQFGKSLVKGE